MKQITYYKHIDNGGITFDFLLEDEIPTIKIKTQYHGYTNVSSSLSGYHLDPKTLRDIASKFNQFAEDYDKHLEKHRED